MPTARHHRARFRSPLAIDSLRDDPRVALGGPCRLTRAVRIVAPTLALAAGLAMPSAIAGPTSQDATETVPTTAPADDRVHAPDLGLEFRQPPSSRVTKERIVNRTVLKVFEDLPTPTWHLSFQPLTASTEGTTASSQIDDYLAGLERDEQRFTVRDRGPRAIRTVDGSLVDASFAAIEVPLERGRSGINAMLVIPVGIDEYLVMLAFTDTESWEGGTDLVIQRLVGSLRVSTTLQRDLEQQVRIITATDALARINERLMREIATGFEPEIYRLTTETEDGGVRELGWQVINATIGPRSAVSNPGATEGELGLLVTLTGRTFASEDGLSTVDIEGRHWLRFDREEEVWSVRRTLRVPEGLIERSVTDAQTGIRSAAGPGRPKPVLEVIESSGSSREREPARWELTEAPYLSQAELLILGHLMTRVGLPDAEYAWYAFGVDQGRWGLRLRSDEWKRVSEGPATLRTTIGGSVIEQRFDADGGRRAREQVGVRLERISRDELEAIYRTKRLPLP